MVACAACLRRAYRNPVSDPRNSSVILPSLTSSRPYACLQLLERGINRQRGAATLAALRKRHHRQQLQEWTKSKTKNKVPPSRHRGKPAGALLETEIKDGIARQKNKAWLMKNAAANDIEDDEGTQEDRGSSDAAEVPPSEWRDENNGRKSLKAESLEQRKLLKRDQKEVELYYKDPLQLANVVLQRLRVPDIEAALRLVRASEHFRVQNIVSWNHCMDWLMAQGQLKDALGVYNEMKKRGHRPDAHTYTIMLRGLSQTASKANAVKEAVKIYNSIFAPNSAVTPSTIHTNAIINVCARGGDMDALWAVAGRLPEKGPSSPDRLTYTLILNAIRENTIKETKKTVDTTTFKGDANAAYDARRRMFEQALADGRKLWEDVSYRWRRADLVIDEQLVCAMGRLLIGCGQGKDVEQVLDLVETTMQLKIPERREKSTRKLPPPSQQSGSLEEIDDESATVSNLPLEKSNIYATPGQKTLAMILDACYAHPGIQYLAPSYWHALTRENRGPKVQPDAMNIMSYLRLLRIRRASARTYEVLSQDWPAPVAKHLYRRGVFVLAFSTCLRDKNNPNVFDIAQKLLKLMRDKLDEQAVGMYDEDVALSEMTYTERKETLKRRRAEERLLSDDELADYRKAKGITDSMEIDPAILADIVQLGIKTTQGWNEGLRGKDDGTVFERDPTKNHTIVALKIAAPHLVDARRLLKVKLDTIQNTPARKQYVSDETQKQVKALLELVRTMISAYDRVIEMSERFKGTGKRELDAKLIVDFIAKKREYNAYMARVEKVTGRQAKNAQAFEAEVEVDDVEDQVRDTWIEKRIKSVIEDVDDKLIAERQREKRRGNLDESDRSSKPRLKPNLSRKLEAQRETRLNDAMEREFPSTDYGEVNKDLNIVTGGENKAALRDERQRQNDPFAAMVRRKQKKPQIGDELNLDDEAVEVNVSARQIDPARPQAAKNDLRPDWMKKRDEITERAGAGWLLRQQRKSMLDRAEVKNAWQNAGAGRKHRNLAPSSTSCGSG